MQGIDRCTRSCVALNLIGMPDLESEIAKRKGAMFGQLCRLDPRYTVMRLFLHRLTSHFFFNDILYGFVVDTLKIISDLGLEGYVLTFLNNGDFPSKYVWKNTCG